MSEEPTQDDVHAIAALREWDAASPEYDVAAGASRFRASLGLPPSPPPGGTAAGGGWGGGVVPIVAAAAVALAAAGWFWAQPVQSTASPLATWELAIPKTPKTPKTPVIAPQPKQAPPTLPVVTASAPPRAAEAPPPTPVRGNAKPTRSKPAAAASPSEVALLRQMRATLPTAPKDALKIGAQLDALHPRGILMEERAAMHVFALDGAGRSAAAARAADAFLTRHPHSPFATRIRAVSSADSKTDLGREDSDVSVQEPK